MNIRKTRKRITNRRLPRRFIRDRGIKYDIRQVLDFVKQFGIKEWLTPQF